MIWTKELRGFLVQHADKPDNYEVWGQADRPTPLSDTAPLTLGVLRRLHQDVESLNEAQMAELRGGGA